MDCSFDKMFRDSTYILELASNHNNYGTNYNYHRFINQHLFLKPMPKRLRTQLLGMGQGEEWRLSTPGNFESTATIPISIGSSLWIACAHGPSYGMIELLPDSNSFAPVIEFPDEFIDTSPWLLSCKYKDECIIVISIHPKDRIGAVFNTKTRGFKEVFTCLVKGRSQSAWCLSCIAIGNHLHIVHGGQYGDYSIYHIFSFHFEEKLFSHTVRSCSQHSQKKHFCTQQRSNIAVFVTHIHCIPSSFCHTYILYITAKSTNNTNSDYKHPITTSYHHSY